MGERVGEWQKRKIVREWEKREVVGEMEKGEERVG